VVTNATPAPSISVSARPQDPEADKWQISPRLLQPSYLDVIAGANVYKILEDKGMTMREVIQRYNTIHNYIPIISREKLGEQIKEAENLNSRGGFMILIMAIILFNDHLTAHSSDAPGLSELYQVCKYHFSLFMLLKKPSIELIQAGLCITLYEYANCITERAYITIGTCARMASLLRHHHNTDSTPQFALTEDNFDESAHVIIAMHLLNW
jgi:hypothetical protein